MLRNRSVWSVLFGLLLVAGLTCSAAADVIHWGDHPDGLEHWYEHVILEEALNWDDARAFAETRIHEGARGHLATITSQGEQDVITGMADWTDMAWFGGFQPAGSPEPSGNWQWITGEPWEYTHWKIDEPNDVMINENVLEIYGTNGPGWSANIGDWNDGRGWVTRVDVVIEYEAVPEPSVMMLLGMVLMGLPALIRRG